MQSIKPKYSSDFSALSLSFSLKFDLYLKAIIKIMKIAIIIKKATNTAINNFFFEIHFIFYQGI